MSGQVIVGDPDASGIVHVRLSHPGRFNAMARAMWRSLREAFQRLATDPVVRCVVVCGADHHFCAGGDISEYPDFRFDEAQLSAFHERDVWGALQAMLDCDVPMVAAIEGHCMGAGLEIASCCDIRVAGVSARFGAPIARLGFPMAPREAALVASQAGWLTVREMLLQAAVLDATTLLQRGFLHEVGADQQIGAMAGARALAIASQSPQAARLNKQTWRALLRDAGAAGLDALARQAYAYADSPEHHEGIAAFLEKRKPRF